MPRPMAYRRHQRHAHINRKKRIIKEQNDYWRYKYDGDLDKGKIHCSCPLCRHKSRDEATHSTHQKVAAAIDGLEEYGPAGCKAMERILHRTKGMPTLNIGESSPN